MPGKDQALELTRRNARHRQSPLRQTGAEPASAERPGVAMTAVDQTWLSAAEVDPLPRDLAAAAIAQYPALAGGQARFVRHGENTTYSVDGPDGVRYALRVHRPGYQSLAALRSELAWMDSLRDAGIRTPVAVAGAFSESPIFTVVPR